MSKQVQIVEIGPRDGFQNVKEFIPTELKLEAIDGLVQAGIRKIQCTSFVSPKHIPQMRDASVVARIVLEKYPNVDFFALVPNFRGAQAAVEAGLCEIAPVMSLSSSHNQANIQRTHQQSIEETLRMRNEFPDIAITQDIATVFGCPFEGRMEIPPLIELMGKTYELGIRAYTLCDTIGVAYPAQVKAVMKAVKAAFPDCEINLHIHDTRNMGLINSYEGVTCGADSIQSSIGGLGGCPFAPGASGNTATEDLAYLLRQEGYDTGLDHGILVETAKKLHEQVEGNYSGHHLYITANHKDFS